MNGRLELGTEGWLRDGEPWEPLRPFYAVLGDPVDHSLSPAMQNAALAERELDAEYLAARIRPGQLRQLKEGDAGRLLAGFNVTAPLKEEAAALCDGRTDPARAVGAVNTVRVEEGRWLGHNTDSGGILTVLCEAWGTAEPPVTATVLGSGGSARAAVDALLRWGLPTIEVRRRPGESGRRFERWLAARTDAAGVSLTGLDEAPAPPTEAGVWLACLPAGVDLRPQLPAAAGAAPALLLDLRYGDQLPGTAPPLGFHVVDGLPVLLMQGGLSFAWWFGPPVPWQAMRAALA